MRLKNCFLNKKNYVIKNVSSFTYDQVVFSNGDYNVNMIDATNGINLLIGIFYDGYCLSTNTNNNMN